MSAALNAFTPADVVEAELKFIIPNGHRPQMFKPAPGQTEGRRAGEFEVKTVPIADSRHLAEHFSLDREGFELTRHATAVSDFLDDDEVRSIYYPEVVSAKGIVVRVADAADRRLFSAIERIASNSDAYRSR